MSSKRPQGSTSLLESDRDKPAEACVIYVADGDDDVGHGSEKVENPCATGGPATDGDRSITVIDRTTHTSGDGERYVRHDERSDTRAPLVQQPDLGIATGRIDDDRRETAANPEIGGGRAMGEKVEPPRHADSGDLIVLARRRQHGVDGEGAEVNLDCHGRGRCVDAQGVTGHEHDPNADGAILLRGGGDSPEHEGRDNGGSECSIHWTHIAQAR